MNRETLIGWTYAAMFFLTFAVSASDPAKVCYGGPNFNWVVPCGVASKTFDGVVAGAAWPLYWVWAAVDRVRG